MTVLAAIPQYETYKDSGIEWLGKIPDSWKVKYLKAESKITLGKMLCPSDKGGYYLRPYLKSKNIQWLRVDILSVDEMWFSQNEMKIYRLKKNDLILSEGGEVGKVCIWQDELEECYIQNSAHKVTMGEKNNARYFLYQMYACGKQGYFDSIVNRVSIAHLTHEKLANIKFVFPSQQEQTAIAHFLDQKTAQIDAAIAIKEKQIALLKERKQILIQQAVTKGLDPTVPMKDSGVEWIGKIPAHWIYTKIKHCIDILPGYAFKSDDYSRNECDIKLLRGINVNPDQVKWDDVVYWSKDKVCGLEKYLLQSGDLIIGMDRPWVSTGIRVVQIQDSDLPALLLQRVSRIRGQYGILTEYVKQLLSTQLFLSYFEPMLTGISVPHISTDQIENFECPIPPINEQKKILVYINSESKKIDMVSSLQQQQIEKLREYKTTLINSAVTGKIRVTPEMAAV